MMGVADGAGEYVGLRAIVGVAVRVGVGVLVTVGAGVETTATGWG
jgi:hypothetical protein